MRAEVAPDAQWQIWYQDMFDRECPRQVEAEGRGLSAGLLELWSRHLFEGVQANGQPGFSRFNLWWVEEARSVAITGDRRGMSRVRKWVYGEQPQTRHQYADGGESLLAQVAAVHGRLIMRGEAGARVLAAASDAADRTDFRQRLAELGGSSGRTMEEDGDGRVR